MFFSAAKVQGNLLHSYKQLTMRERSSNQPEVIQLVGRESGSKPSLFPTSVVPNLFGQLIRQDSEAGID